ncbi:DNA polymerase III subunit theta [Candidatus Gillettellia adelgis]
MSYNLAKLGTEDIDKINVDLAASGVAYKERHKIAVLPHIIERTQPMYLRNYFHERVAYYRIKSHSFPSLPMNNNINYKRPPIMR